MKALKLIFSSAAITLFFACCGDPNHPVQTASPQTDSGQVETSGSTPVKADSVSNSTGPDQMVPDNTGPKTPSAN